MPTHSVSHLIMPSECRLIDGYIYAELPYKLSRKKISGALFKQALDRFCEIRSEKQACGFVRAFGMPTNKLNKYDDIIELKSLLGLAATAKWVRHLISCHQSNCSDGIEIVNVTPSVRDYLTDWKEGLNAAEESDLLTAFPGFKSFDLGHLESILTIRGVITNEYTTDQAQSLKFKQSQPALSKWLEKEMAPLKCKTWYAVIPDSLLKPTIGWQSSIQFWGTRYLGVPQEPQHFAVPEAKGLNAANKKRYLIDQTLRRYFKKLLPIRCSIEVNWERQFMPPTTVVTVERLIDGMLNQLLIEWQSSKYKPCLNSKCNDYVEFKRTTKLFCSNRCRMAHKRMSLACHGD